MYNPLISIIVPTYNVKEVILNCIQSIINQTYSNFEILIMDGDSTDGTIELVKTRKDNRIKLFSQPDKGIYDAMNKGIALAKGDWLYFMGADDLLANHNILSSIFNKKKNNKYDFIYGNVILKSNNHIYDGKFNLKKLKEKNICHQAIFYKKEVFKRLGNYDLKWPVLSDWDFNIKCFINRKIIKKYINITIANFNDCGISSGYSEIGFYKYKNELIQQNTSFFYRILF